MCLYDGDISRILVTEEEINRICTDLGSQISKDYINRSVLIIGVLKGSVVFTADLLRKLQCHCEIDFITISSYCGSKPSKQPEIKKDLDVDVSGRDVLIVEDILDTGNTLLFIKKLMLERNAASVKICAFLDKPSRRVADINADYVGKAIADEFVVGYGLDYNEKYRNLPFVGVLSKSALTDK